MSSVGPDSMLLGSGARKGNDNAGERKTEMEVGTRIRAALIGLVIPWPGDLSPKSLGIRSSPLFPPNLSTSLNPFPIYLKLDWNGMSDPAISY